MAKKERTAEQRVHDPRVKQMVEEVVQSLRAGLRRQKLSQREIQKRVGWGASYVSQMFNGSKGLRLDSVLLMLHAAGIEPAAFFAEHFKWAGVALSPPAEAGAPAAGPKAPGLDQLRFTLDYVVQRMVANRLLDLEKMAEAAAKAGAAAPASAHEPVSAMAAT